jgi:hypothetical protein
MTANTDWSLDEIVRRGKDLFATMIEPTLRPNERGRFVAVDVRTGEFETDDDDMTAAHNLRRRCPKAEIWLGRVGEAAAYQLRAAR